MKLVISQTISNAVEVEKKIANCVIAPFDTGVGAIPLATITAKGDMIVGTGSGAVDNVAVGANGDVWTADSAQAAGAKWAPPEAGAGLPCDGRLTLTSGTPITSSDVTAAVEIFFTPFKGNRIALYIDSEWRVSAFPETSLSLSGLGANTNFDMFMFKDGSTLKLAAKAWTNNTTPAVATAYKDGVLMNNAAFTPDKISSGIAGELAQYSARYLGSFRTTGTAGQCEHSYTKRFVYNYYNQVFTTVLTSNSTANWSYTGAVDVREYNNGTGQTRGEFILGVIQPGVMLFATPFFIVTSGTPTIYSGLTLDTSTFQTIQATNASIYPVRINNSNLISVAAGYHYLTQSEYASGGNVTFYGPNYGGKLVFLA